MKSKSKGILAITVVIACAGLITAPVYAEDPITPIEAVAAGETAVLTSVAVETTGTIHVENIVTNDNLGYKTASDFQFTIKHFGNNVAGSPFSITETSNTHFTLEPGTYVVAVVPVDGYLGTWTGDGIDNGFINLKAGQDVTITRNTYDVGIAAKTYPTYDPTTEPMTQDGGTLPVTSSIWFNALALGLLLSAAGALGFRKNSLNR